MTTKEFSAEAEDRLATLRVRAQKRSKILLFLIGGFFTSTVAVAVAFLFAGMQSRPIDVYGVLSLVAFIGLGLATIVFVQAVASAVITAERQEREMKGVHIKSG